jgi:putative membrane protein
MMGLGMGFGSFGLLFMLLLWGGLIVLAIWLVRVLFPQTNVPVARGQPTAAEILNRRYARGEISREEYHAMREVLRDGVRWQKEEFI